MPSENIPQTDQTQPLLGEGLGIETQTDKEMAAYKLGRVLGLATGENFTLRAFNGTLVTKLYKLAARAETAEQKAKAERWRADHDPLTGLLSKQAWVDKVQEQIETNEPFSIIYMDMDGFKGINDNLNHERGDKVLEEFGAFMSTRMRRADDAASYLTGRLGGDEFATIVNLNENDRRATQTDKRLQNAIDYLASSLKLFVASQPDDIKQLKKKFDVSFGIVEYDPNKPEDAKSLINRADGKMYEAKRIHGAVDT